MPLAALWLGTSAIGDLVEDRLLVYLWLKPVPRWQLPAAAVLATVTVVVPLTARAAAASRRSSPAPASWRSPRSSPRRSPRCAYAGLFVAAGLWFRRAVWWGLAFVVLWENVVAHSSEGVGPVHRRGLGVLDPLARPRTSTSRSTRGSRDGRVRRAAAVAVAGWLVATWRYRRADVD